MLSEMMLHTFPVYDEGSVFFTFLHRTKKKQIQWPSIDRTRFCLRVHGYVLDLNMLFFSPSLPLNIHASNSPLSPLIFAAPYFYF